jgi:hypothetical protein
MYCLDQLFVGRGELGHNISVGGGGHCKGVDSRGEVDGRVSAMKVVVVSVKFLLFL